MKRHRRWFELVVRVGALLSAVAWALKSPHFASIGPVLLLCAASVASAHPVRPGRAPRWLAVVVYLGLAGLMGIVVVRAWPFAGTVLAVWAGVAAVPTLAWIYLNLRTLRISRTAQAFSTASTIRT